MKKKKKKRKKKKMKKMRKQKKKKRMQKRERKARVRFQGRRRETTSAEGKEVPYPLVPSKKDKERHLAIFLDIFKKLEITMPFGEALQQMPLYAKFLKDMLTRKNRYIHSDTIVMEGNMRLGYF